MRAELHEIHGIKASGMFDPALGRDPGISRVLASEDLPFPARPVFADIHGARRTILSWRDLLVLTLTVAQKVLVQPGLLEVVSGLSIRPGECHEGHGHVQSLGACVEYISARRSSRVIPRILVDLDIPATLRFEDAATGREFLVCHSPRPDAASRLSRLLPYRSSACDAPGHRLARPPMGQPASALGAASNLSNAALDRLSARLGLPDVHREEARTRDAIDNVAMLGSQVQITIPGLCEERWFELGSRPSDPRNGVLNVASDIGALILGAKAGDVLSHRIGMRLREITVHDVDNAEIRDRLGISDVIVLPDQSGREAGMAF